jgi:hypothetical protein
LRPEMGIELEPVGMKHFASICCGRGTIALLPIVYFGAKNRSFRQARCLMAKFFELPDGEILNGATAPWSRWREAVVSPGLRHGAFLGEAPKRTRGCEFRLSDGREVVVDWVCEDVRNSAGLRDGEGWRGGFGLQSVSVAGLDPRREACGQRALLGPSKSINRLESISYESGKSVARFSGQLHRLASLLPRDGCQSTPLQPEEDPFASGIVCAR